MTKPGTLIGAGVGLLLAFFALQFGFWGFLLAIFFMTIGAVAGGALTGSLNLKAAFEAARSR